MIWHIQSGCANTTLCLQHSSESHKGNLDVIVPVSLAPELKTHLPPPALKQCDSYRCVHRVHPSPYRHCFRRTVPWVHQEIQPWYFSRGSDTTYGNGLSFVCCSDNQNLQNSGTPLQYQWQRSYCGVTLPAGQAKWTSPKFLLPTPNRSFHLHPRSLTVPLPSGESFHPVIPESSMALCGQKSKTAHNRNKFHALPPAP